MRWYFLLAPLALASCGSPEPTTVPPPPPSPAATLREPEPAASTGTSAPVAQARAALSDCMRGSEFLALWDSIDAPARAALAASDDTSVALQARWELERRVIASDRTPHELDAAGIERFLELVGERTGGAPPGWWADALRSARFHPTTGATSYGGMLELRADRIGRPVAWGARRVQAVDGVNLDAAADGTLRVVASPVGVTLPADALGSEPILDLHVLPIPPASMILAPLPAGLGIPYVASRRDADAQRWSTEVCGGGRENIGGAGAGFVEIIRRDELALLFGAESHAVYVDALHVDDGALAFRFNSDLWFARHAAATE